MYGPGYQSVPHQGQTFSYYHAMMPGYGQPFTPQQMQQQQQQQHQQQQQQQQQQDNNQGKQLHQQPPVPGTPMSLDDDSELPPLPPGPPPSVQTSQQHNNQVQPTIQPHPGYMYNAFSYGTWNGMHNDMSRKFTFHRKYKKKNIFILYIK